MNSASIRGAGFLVTGAAGGIGRELVRGLLAADGRVLATDVNPDALAALAQAAPGVEVLAGDVRNEADWQALFHKAQSLFGSSFFSLINAAGVLKPGYLSEASAADVAFHFDINAKGVAIGSVMAAAIFRKEGKGHIINIASLAGIAPVPGLALYSASKFAVRGLTLALAEEMRPHGVHVTVICPDAVDTGMLDLQIGLEETRLTFSGREKPLTPEDVSREIISVIGKERLEVTIPALRGALARLGGGIPELNRIFFESLLRKGEKNQKNWASVKSGKG